MTWVDVTWPLLAGASLMVGLMHALIWAMQPKQPTRPVHLVFAVAAISVAVLAVLELAVYRSTTPAAMASLMRWMHVSITTMVLSLLYVLHRWFGYGSVYIAMAAGVLRVAALVVNFSIGDNLNFLSINGVNQAYWWGAPMSHPQGIANPWIMLAVASNALVLVYVGQTLVRALRQPAPQRNAALLVGGSWLLMIGVMVLSAVMMTLGLPWPPLLAAPGFIIVVVAISYQLASAMLRSHRLALDLQRSEVRRLQSEQEVANERAIMAHLSRVTLMGELSGSLAHELNQPLAAILSNAQAAQRMLQRNPSNTTEIPEILADIIENDRRASQVIVRMRGFLKKEATEHVPLAINDVVQDCMRLMRRELHDRGIPVHVDLQPDLPLCPGDRVQLQQVILNLVMNACDAICDALVEGGRVEVRTSASSAGVRVAVLDNGAGIPEPMLDQIFAPFETSKESGMGLGLPVCRTIVQAHGGRIWAENATGARICFELPRHE